MFRDTASARFYFRFSLLKIWWCQRHTYTLFHDILYYDAAAFQLRRLYMPLPRSIWCALLIFDIYIWSDMLMAQPLLFAPRRFTRSIYIMRYIFSEPLLLLILFLSRFTFLLPLPLPWYIYIALWYFRRHIYIYEARRYGFKERAIFAFHFSSFCLCCRRFSLSYIASRKSAALIIIMITLFAAAARRGATPKSSPFLFKEAPYYFSPSPSRRYYFEI